MCVCVWRLTEGKAVMPGNAEAKSQGSASPRRADGRVGSAGAEGPLSLILSCTCKICAACEMPWQRSTSFNSSCTPERPTPLPRPASCFCKGSPGIKTSLGRVATPATVKTRRLRRCDVAERN